MTDSLTIKDLNCSTCDFGKAGVKILYPNGELKARLIKCQKLNRALLHEESDMITQTGCASHPLALQVLSGPVIAELERCKVQESLLPEETPQQIFDMAMDYAIKLLKGEVELP